MRRYAMRAVLFDLFETLVTLQRGTPYFGAVMAADLGIAPDEFLSLWRSTDDDRTRGRIPLEEVLRGIQRACGTEDEARLQAVLARRRAFPQSCMQQLHPGILPMLDALRHRGVPIGLVSNCYREEAAALRHSPLLARLDALSLSCEAGAAKPEEALYLRCTAQLGVSPSDCLYVGDGGSSELETARRLGMDARQARWYLLPGSSQPVGPLPDFPHFNDPMDVLSCLA